jgi:DNA (cytosine-5)-methyltransferase 1
MENVRGIQSMRDESGTDYPSRIKARLEAGPRGHRYGVASATIDLGGFGLAQTRLRWIMVAMRLDAGGTAAAEVIVQRLADGSSKRLRTLRSAIGDLPRVSVCGGAEVLEGPDGRTWFNHQSLKHSDQLIKRLQHVPPEGGLPDVPRSLLTPHLIRVLEGAYGSGGHAKNIYGRLSWSKPCGTIVAGIDKITCGRFVHPEEDRLLTPRECARIQSFPDRFRFLKSLVNSYYLIGNAVPPKAGAAIADAIASFLVTKRRASRRQTQ